MSNIKFMNLFSFDKNFNRQIDLFLNIQYLAHFVKILFCFVLTIKKLNFCHKLKFTHPYIFTNGCCKP